MSEEAKGGVVMRDFGGLVTNLDPRDLPPGVSDVQVNVNSRVGGELNVRRGLQEVKFDGS
jgi:hypothetical protein